MSPPGPGQLWLLTMCLSEQEAALLAFAAAHHWHGQVGERVQADLGCSETRYYLLLAGLLDRPEALAAEPELLGRLRELRDRRSARRRRVGPGSGAALAASGAAR